ncbi:hypothetical protein BHM03_00019613 [Ensete ventricosum]|nr:hypothetical protein BHM03_00019613 [Ensete ventricosum]
MIRPSRSSGDGLVERANPGTNPGDLAERTNSGTNPGYLAERVNSGTNPGDLAERANSGTNLGDLAERMNSGTNPGDLVEGVNSGTNPGDLAERRTWAQILEIWPRGNLYRCAQCGSTFNAVMHLMRRVVLGWCFALPREAETTLLDPINFLRQVETSLARFALFYFSLGSPPSLLASLQLGFSEQVGMTSSDSSSSVRVISSPGSGGVSLGDPEASPSRASSGPPSPVDARALRDLKVMKADHDLDTAVTEGSLSAIRERYSIPAEYGLHVPQSRQHPYSSDALGMCISVDALEACLRFPLHPLIEECLRWWRISPNQVAPNSWCYLVVFLGECRGAGIIPTWDMFMACFHLCKNRGGYYLTVRVGFRVSGAPSNNKSWKSRYLFVSGLVWGFRLDWSAHPIGNAPPYLSEEESVLVGRLKGILSSSCAIKVMTELWLVEAGLSPVSRDRMDLDDLHGMPKVFGGKTSSVRVAVPAWEVGVSPAREAPKTFSKRPIDAPTEQIDDPARRQKKVKILTRRHKSRHGEGGSRSHSKGKEPVAPVEEPEMLEESDEGDASPVHHRPRSMKDLFKTKVHKDVAGGVREGTSPPTVGPAVHAPLGGFAGPSRQGDDIGKFSTLIALFDRVHDAGRLITFIDYCISHLQQEINTLKFGGVSEAVAKAEEHASELEQELEKTKRERDKALQRLEASEKELNEVRSNLTEIQRLLKEAWVKARKMDDELLQSVKALENARAELPRQAVDHYKESVGFKEGLKRMGRVTYEYGYLVALPRFRALHSDSEVEEDPFTIRPEDDLVPMERQQAFDDSESPES